MTIWRVLPIFLVFSAGCHDTEYISVKRDAPLRLVGDSCTVDAECDTGRCVDGSCGDDGCRNDEDCRSDEICVFGACLPADDFACQTDQRPILSITQTSMTFDQVALGSSASQVVTIENVGDCLLTLQVISFSENSSDDFGCSPCSAEFFPQRIPPRRTLDVTVEYTPTRPGEANGSLLLRSDDVTAGTAGLVSIELLARYDGIPALVVEPLSLAFGFVPFTAGGGAGTRTETLTLTNRGTGSAALPIERLFLQREDVFFVTAIRQGDAVLDLNAIDAETPLLIPPFDIDNALSTVEVDVTFTPNDNRDFSDAVVVRPGGLSGEQRVTVELSGSSLGPPQIEVTVAEMVFGGPGQEAMPVGAVDFKQVTIRNNGQSELVVNPAIGGGNAANDFSVMPNFVPPIAAGGAIILSVFYNPSVASDPAQTFSPTRFVEAALNITSNDTSPGTDVLKNVALRGFARSGVQDQILKVEMEFDNADNSWAGSDFRNVDVVLTSDDGAVTCTKPQITDVNGNGFDFCGDWTAAASYGQANWLSLGAFEEPERVVLRGLGPTGANGEGFNVEVVYMEDCANIPSGLLSDILGVGASVLLGALGGAIGVPVAVPPASISDAIASNCFDHASSQVVTRISLDGAVIASPTVRLNNKGDRAVTARLRRINGAYCSLTPGVGNVDLQCQ